MRRYKTEKFEFEKKGETRDQLVQMIRQSGSSISLDALSSMSSEKFLYGQKEGKVLIIIVEAGYFGFPLDFTEKQLFSEDARDYFKARNCKPLDARDAAYLRSVYITQPFDETVWCIQEKIHVPHHHYNFTFTIECNEKEGRSLKVLNLSDETISPETLLAVSIIS